MSSKLDAKLLQFEKQRKIANDEELLQVLEQIIDAEEALPLEKRDAELIEEAVQFAVSLKYSDIDEEKVSEIAEHIDPERLLAEFSKSRNAETVPPKKKKVRRWLIPVAAVISILLAVTIGVYAATGYDLWGLAREAFAGLSEKIFYSDSNRDIVKTGDYGTYYSMEEFENKVSYSDILLPYNLCDEYTLEKIIVENYGEKDEITFYMTYDGTEYKTYITIPNTAAIDQFETERIGSYDVVISAYDDLFQGEFVYKDNNYRVQADSLENLKNLIECLEEKRS